MDDFVKLVNVTKTYKMGEIKIRAVDGINFIVKKGEFVVIVGAKRRRKDDGFEYPWRYGPCDQRADMDRRDRYWQVHEPSAHRLPPGGHWLCISVL